MKGKNLLLNGFFALATMAAFTQCDNNNATNTSAGNPVNSAGTSGLKIAYVEIDSLLSNYTLCKDLNEMMIRKQENVEVTLNVNIKTMFSLQKELNKNKTVY